LIYTQGKRIERKQETKVSTVDPARSMNDLRRGAKEVPKCEDATDFSEVSNSLGAVNEHVGLSIRRAAEAPGQIKK
jgi:hypothetical protein